MNSYLLELRKEFREGVKTELEQSGEDMKISCRTMYTTVFLADYLLTIYYDGTVEICDTLTKESYSCTRTKCIRDIREMNGRKLFWVMVRAETERRMMAYLKENYPAIQRCFF